MNQTLNRCPGWLGSLVLICLVSVGCERYRTEREDSADRGTKTQRYRLNLTNGGSELHPHRGGVPAGVLTSLGRDEFHAEAMLTEEGRLEIFILGADETRPQEIEPHTLSAYIKPTARRGSIAIVLEPEPLAGDSPGKTSRFGGEIPAAFRQGSLSITVPGLRIEGQRFTARFTLEDDLEAMMPSGVSSEEAQSLYLTPGGRYTNADIAANGGKTAGEIFRDFRAEHDPNPQPGDWLCPITFTKANLKCGWIIGGETYYFCCPPCIDEFLTWAKTDSERIQPAASYRK